jgi:hypothetical protein
MPRNMLYTALYPLFMAFPDIKFVDYVYKISTTDYTEVKDTDLRFQKLKLVYIFQSLVHTFHLQLVNQINIPRTEQNS